MSRDKIAAENNIGAGTVSNIVNGYKTQIENLDLGSVRELAVEIRKQGFSSRDLASHIRLYNFFRQSGVPEEEIESFIAIIHSSGIPKEKVVEYVNQIHEIAKDESIPLHEVPSYIKQKLEEKQNVDQEIKAANDILQNKKVSIEAINEHIKLKEELGKHGILIQDLDKLLNLLSNAKEYGFDSKIIVRKLRSIRQLENKHERLNRNCEILSAQVKECNKVLPLAQKMVAMNIDISQLWLLI